MSGYTRAMSAHCVVTPVQNYQDTAAIHDFVERALNLSSKAAQLFARPDPRRLVVVKPNWGCESRQDRPDDWETVITHPDLVMGVVEVLARRMSGEAPLRGCAAPTTYSDWATILGRGELASRLAALGTRWPGLKIELIDLRREIWITRENVVVERYPNVEDPRGYVCYDLGSDSMLHQHRWEGRYFGADYDASVVNKHHYGSKHEYLIAGTPVHCDLF